MAGVRSISGGEEAILPSVGAKEEHGETVLVLLSKRNSL